MAEYGPDAVLFHARQGDIEEVKRLVSVDSSVVQYIHVVTPLMWAAYMNHIRLAHFLIGQGADVNQIEVGKGRTALYLAAGRGHVQMVSLLLKRGADASLRRTGGWDPLSVAASEAHVEVVKVLLDQASVDVNGADADGCTALHRAAAWGRTEVVRLLLSRGADWTLASKGRTAVDMARERGRTQCVNVLENAQRLYVVNKARRVKQETSFVLTSFYACRKPHSSDIKPWLKYRVQDCGPFPVVSISPPRLFGCLSSGAWWAALLTLSKTVKKSDRWMREEARSAVVLHVVCDMSYDVLENLKDLLLGDTEL